MEEQPVKEKSPEHLIKLLRVTLIKEIERAKGRKQKSLLGDTEKNWEKALNFMQAHNLEPEELASAVVRHVHTTQPQAAISVVSLSSNVAIQATRKFCLSEEEASGTPLEPPPPILTISPYERFDTELEQARKLMESELGVLITSEDARIAFLRNLMLPVPGYIRMLIAGGDQEIRERFVEQARQEIADDPGLIDVIDERGFDTSIFAVN